MKNKEKSCSEWLKEMAKEGFTGKFKATNGEQTYTGEITKDGEIKSKRITTQSESMAKIRGMLNGD